MTEAEMQDKLLRMEERYKRTIIDLKAQIKRLKGELPHRRAIIWDLHRRDHGARGAHCVARGQHQGVPAKGSPQPH